MNDASCRHVTLARGSAAAISFCPECNALAIHMGAVTLRLPPAGAEALWATLGEALHALPVHVEARARGPVGHA